MKVSKLVLCILLSLTLVVTFIPVMSFAQDDGANAQVQEEVTMPEDMARPADVEKESEELKAAGDTRANTGKHEVTVDGVDSYQSEENYYSANLSHGTLHVYAELEEGSSNTFLVSEYSAFHIEIVPTGDYGVASVKYSLDGGKTKSDAYPGELNNYFVVPPAISGEYKVTVYITFGLQHAVKFNDVSSFVQEIPVGYRGELEHGYVGLLGSYDEVNNCFYFAEGQEIELYYGCESGWDIGNVQYSTDGGATKNNAVSSSGRWYFTMPSGGGDYTVTVWISFIPCTTAITSVEFTLKAPLCGTKVTGTQWNGPDRQKPQPEIVLPNGANYEPDGNSTLNYGIWNAQTGRPFQGTINAGETYAAYIYLRVKKGSYFDSNCSIKVNGKEPEYLNRGEKAMNMTIMIEAVHDWTSESKTPAGLLKNGTDFQHCKAEGCTATRSVVIPGWAKYYVKKLKVKKGKKSFTVKWKKQSKKNLKKFNGYQIRYSTKANMSGAKTVNAGKKSKGKKIKKLAKKTKYYVQVRTFTKKGSDTFYSKWSKAKKVKTK